MRVASQLTGAATLVSMVCGHLESACNDATDSETFKQSLFRATALLISTHGSGEGTKGMLFESLSVA